MAFGESRRLFIKHLVLGWDGVFCCGSTETLGFVILTLGWSVLGNGQQLVHVADTFGHALSEEHLSPHLQVFWVLDELEENHCFLACPQLLLWYSDVS